MIKMHNYVYREFECQIDLRYDAHCGGTSDAITNNFTLPT